LLPATPEHAEDYNHQYQRPINLAPGANHYRLVGLEITSNSTQGGNPSNIRQQ